MINVKNKKWIMKKYWIYWMSQVILNLLPEFRTMSMTNQTEIIVYSAKVLKSNLCNYNDD